MSREAIKLALEALENSWTEPGNKQYEFEKEAITALREALAKPDFWEGYVPEPVKPAQREPVVVFREIKVGEYVLRFWPSDNGWMCGITSEIMQALAEQPAQQEPVAYIHRQGNHYEVSERFLSDDEKSRGWTEEPLYTSPPAQRTWVGLTTEDMATCINEPAWDLVLRKAEQILKEKNT